MKKLIQRVLFWALLRTGWTPETKVETVNVKVFRSRLWSGNAHQRRVMMRAWNRAYPEALKFKTEI